MGQVDWGEVQFKFGVIVSVFDKLAVNGLTEVDPNDVGPPGRSSVTLFPSMLIILNGPVHFEMCARHTNASPLIESSIVIGTGPSLSRSASETCL